MNAQRREQLTAAVARLKDEQQRRGGELPGALVSTHARLLGVSRSTMYRYMKNGVPDARARPRGWSWQAAERAALQVAGGQVAHARQLLDQDPTYGQTLPSLRRMQALRHRDIPTDLQALYTHGAAAAKQHQLTTLVETSRRNEVWIADHFQFTVFATPPRARPARPWATVVMDAYSRRVLGAALSTRPNQGHVLAALRSAITSAGVPTLLVFDRGLEFTADAITQAANDLVFSAAPTVPYHPEHKGKIERLIRTLKGRTARHFPDRTSAATKLNKRPILGITDGGVPAVPPPLEVLVSAYFAEVEDYNNTVHGSLAATPAEVYESDATPERRVPHEHLRRFLLKEGTRDIREHGLRFDNRWYYAEELDGHRGTGPVEIRFTQDDLSRLEVFRADGTWWCTARLRDPASPVLREELLAHRRARAAEQGKVTRRARRLAKRNYEAMISAVGVRETTTVTREEAEAELRVAPSRQASVLGHLGHAWDEGRHR